jgi:hypothetical protein
MVPKVSEGGIFLGDLFSVATFEGSSKLAR